MKKGLLSCAVVLLPFLGGLPVYALEPLGMYDNFNTTFIDPDKWLGDETSTSAREIVRRIFNRHLQMMLRVSGNMIFDTGSFTDSNRLVFVNPNPIPPVPVLPVITAMEATIQVKKVTAVGCAANPVISCARARLRGYFFNVGVPTPGNSLNDVYAEISVQRHSDSIEPANVLDVVYTVAQCTSSGCSTTATLFAGDLGTVLVGTSVRLRVQWDKANHRFEFQRDALTPELASYFPVSDANPPGFLHKRLDVLGQVPNCLPPAPRPVAFMDAAFDNVKVNESAVP